jgi:EAL domain-containing protein (putative c-di-GMP-specific phosphodiesterase class I)
MPDPEVPSANNPIPRDNGRRVADALGVSPTPLYQPIVSLPEGAVVGFEALARWPTLGYPDPQRVFNLARTEPAALAKLDERCITSALDTFLEPGGASDALLFINTFPSCEFPSEAVDARAKLLSAHRLHLVFELIENHLLVHPRTLMSKVDAIRERGWAIALDDVGVNTTALPLLDIVRPEIVKLNVSLVQSVPHNYESRVMAAVLTYRERTNAIILAEGVETTKHYKQALAWGATLGQGYRFARPGPPATMRLSSSREVRFPTSAPLGAVQITNSPFDMLIAAGAEPRRMLMSTFEALARHLRVIATLPENPSIVIVVLPDDDRFRLVETALRRLEKAAATIPFIAVFGHNLPQSVAAPNVHPVPIGLSDPLSRELLVLTLGPHAAAAVASRGPDGRRLIDSDSRLPCVITYDRQHVTTIASHLLARIP